MANLETLQHSERIRDLARSLKSIDPSASYAAATLTAKHGKMMRSFYSHFAGFPKGIRPGEGIELRQASIVDPYIMCMKWDKVGQEWIVVNALPALIIFLRYGGNALITESIAREHFSEYMEPHVCISRGAGGFIRQDADFPELRNRRPRPKQRERILERDGHRCQMLGCRASAEEDAELQLHHIRPFSQDGPTLDENLITLCQDCHRSLDPHYQPDLYWATGGPLSSAIESENAETHRREVENYRRLVARKLDSLPDRD